MDNEVIRYQKVSTISSSYLLEDGSTVAQNGCSRVSLLVDNPGVTMANGWYVVDESKSFDNRIQIVGTVHLILADGTTLNANKGIHVPHGSTFHVWGQSWPDVNTMGKLKADARSLEGYAGIGGEKEASSGMITLNGGVISASSTSYAAAIGGGYGTNSNTYDTEVTITGGDITAISEGTGFGIGGGYSRNATVTVSGGSITASSIGGTNSDEHPSVISLSWKDLTDTILADSYLGTVTLQKSFKIGTTNGYIGLIEDNSILNGNVLSISKFIGHSLTLSGDIGLNFYINLTMEEVMQGVSLNFSWDVEGEEQTDSVTLSAANKTDNGYKISVSVPVA